MKLSLTLLSGVFLSLGCSFVQAQEDIGPDLYKAFKQYDGKAPLPDKKPKLIDSGSIGVANAARKCKEENPDYAIYVMTPYQFQSTTNAYACVGRLIKKNFKLRNGMCNKGAKDAKQNEKEKHLWTYCSDNGRFGLQVCDGSDKQVNCEDVPWYSTSFKPGNAPNEHQPHTRGS